MCGAINFVWIWNWFCRRSHCQGHIYRMRLLIWSRRFLFFFFYQWRGGRWYAQLWLFLNPPPPSSSQWRLMISKRNINPQALTFTNRASYISGVPCGCWAHRNQSNGHEWLCTLNQDVTAKELPQYIVQIVFMLVRTYGSFLKHLKFEGWS